MELAVVIAQAIEQGTCQDAKSFASAPKSAVEETSYEANYDSLMLPMDPAATSSDGASVIRVPAEVERVQALGRGSPMPIDVPASVVMCSPGAADLPRSTAVLTAAQVSPPLPSAPPTPATALRQGAEPRRTILSRMQPEQQTKDTESAEPLKVHAAECPQPAVQGSAMTRASASMDTSTTKARGRSWSRRGRCHRAFQRAAPAASRRSSDARATRSLRCEPSCNSCRRRQRSPLPKRKLPHRQAPPHPAE